MYALNTDIILLYYCHIYSTAHLLGVFPWFRNTFNCYIKLLVSDFQEFVGKWFTGMIAEVILMTLFYGVH